MHPGLRLLKSLLPNLQANRNRYRSRTEIERSTRLSQGALLYLWVRLKQAQWAELDLQGAQKCHSKRVLQQRPPFSNIALWKAAAHWSQIEEFLSSCFCSCSLCFLQQVQDCETAVRTLLMVLACHILLPCRKPRLLHSLPSVVFAVVAWETGLESVYCACFFVVGHEPTSNTTHVDFRIIPFDLAFKHCGKSDVTRSGFGDWSPADKVKTLTCKQERDHPELESLRAFKENCQEKMPAWLLMFATPKCEVGGVLNPIQPSKAPSSWRLSSSWPSGLSPSPHISASPAKHASFLLIAVPSQTHALDGSIFLFFASSVACIKTKITCGTKFRAGSNPEFASAPNQSPAYTKNTASPLDLLSGKLLNPTTRLNSEASDCFKML